MAIDLQPVGLWCAILGILLGCHCGDRDRERPSPVAAPATGGTSAPALEPDAGTSTGATAPLQPAESQVVARPLLANAGAATCAVGEPVPVGEGGKRLQSLEVGFGAAGGLVAWPVGKGRVAVAAIDRAGSSAGPTKTLEIPGAKNVYGIEALGDRFVLVTHDLCPDQKYFFKCLYARLLDSAGKPLGAPTTEVTREWVREEFHERLGPAEIWVLRSHMYVPPVINSFGLADDELSIGVVRALDGGGDLSWARGFAVHERRWHALVESEEGRLALMSGGTSRRPLHWLSAESKVLGFDWHDQGLILLFAPLLESGKPGRPRLARLGEAGELRGKPRVLAKGEHLPPPFGDRVEALLSKDGAHLVFQRQDPSGAPIGESAIVAPFPRGGRDDPGLALTWTGERFLAVWSSLEQAGWKIHAAPIDCRPGTRGGGISKQE
jgi:hypothetical protein